MLLIQKNENSVPPMLILSGTIDETTDLDHLLGSAGNKLFLQCRDVHRINSVGIKLWRDFFQKFRRSSGQVKFFELSPPLVATMNYISDFIALDEIESLCGPFHCGKCNTVTLKHYTIDEAKLLLSNSPAIPCEKCQTPAELDEIPDDYFAFLLPRV